MVFVKLLILFIPLAFLFCFSFLPRFGALPKGQDQIRIEKSSHYHNGRFHNLRHELPVVARKMGRLEVLYKLIQQQYVSGPIPSTFTNLFEIASSENVCVWFGHSSYFLQIEGIKILVDPIFSKVASPFLFFPRALPGSDLYKPNDIPEIDLLIITHDHWDHLDYNTVTKLKCKKVICPLGVGAHLRKWGIRDVTELDWDDNIQVSQNFRLTCLPSQHFSGRWLTRNKSLWASFLLETPSGKKIFMGCDGGYGSHFKKMGKKFGNIDIAFLENGQYNENWPYIHMFPHETLQAAQDLNARVLVPIHNSKFCLAPHTWSEPTEKLLSLPNPSGICICSLKIGEKVNFDAFLESP